MASRVARVTCFLSATLVPGSSFASTWVNILRSAGGTVYEVDQDSVERDGDVVTFSMRGSGHEGMNGDSDGFLSRMKVDCAASTYTYLHQDDLKGGSITKSSGEGAPRTPKAHSVAESLIKKVCSPGALTALHTEMTSETELRRLEHETAAKALSKDYSGALQMSDSALAYAKAENIPHLAAYADTMALRGAIYLQLKRYTDAENALNEALTIMYAVSGDRSRRYYEGLYVLGSVFRAEGKFSDAEANDRRVLIWSTEKLGQNDPFTLNVNEKLSMDQRHETVAAPIADNYSGDPDDRVEIVFKDGPWDLHLGQHPGSLALRFQEGHEWGLDWTDNKFTPTFLHNPLAINYTYFPYHARGTPAPKPQSGLVSIAWLSTPGVKYNDGWEGGRYRCILITPASASLLSPSACDTLLNETLPHRKVVWVVCSHGEQPKFRDHGYAMC